MKVDFFNLKRQYEGIKEEVEKTTIEVLRSGNYVNGPIVSDFENNIKEFLNVKHAIMVSSGTAALMIALRASGVNYGDEVITSPFTFFATAEAIASIGAIPVFVDIDEKTLNIDPNMIERAINDKTKAILPVHIFGKCADMDAINEIAKRHNLKVIEDCAQAIGAKFTDKYAGTLGDVGCFSFYPTKNLGAFGDGGMITTNDDDLALICNALKSHGAGKIGSEARNILENVSENNIETIEQSATSLYDPYKYYNYLIAYNSRLDAMQANVLNIKLNHLNDYNNSRSRIATKYISELKGLEFLTLPIIEENKIDCWHQFVIRVKDKNGFISYLNSNDIGCGNFYPVPLHLQKAFDYLKYNDGSLPIAEKVCDETVCLPVFPELTDEEVDYIISVIKEYKEV